MNNFIRLSLLMILCWGTGQLAHAGDFPREIHMADQKVVLQQYDEAEAIYKQVIRSSDSVKAVAYAHYKVGALYKKKNDHARARREYVKGLELLRKSGIEGHQIGRYLAQAIEAEG